jgi:hypothetical protein
MTFTFWFMDSKTNRDAGLDLPRQLGLARHCTCP